MKITVHSETHLEYVQIDNTYTEEEQKLIMIELEFLNSKNSMLQPSETKSAVDPFGNVLKSNKALFLDSIYTDRSTSNILTCNRKLFYLTLPFDDLHPVFRAVKDCTKDATMVSYYENNDHYKPHADNSVITALTYFYKKPKSFSGGNLILGDKVKKSLEPIYNATYIFPGLVTHEVERVSLDTSLCDSGLGRYCITSFMLFN